MSDSENPVRLWIGTNLRIVREAKGLTIGMAGEKMNWPDAKLEALEKGEGEVTLWEFLELCRYYNTDGVVILSQDFHGDYDRFFEMYALTAKRIVTYFRQLTPAMLAFRGLANCLEALERETSIFEPTSPFEFDPDIDQTQN